MSGKSKIDFTDLFDMQELFQKHIVANKSGEDVANVKIKEDVDWFQYHCMAMIEEMGEVVKADKRWKTHRNDRYVPDEKLDELADVFITAMNITMFSGFTCEELQEAIANKIETNFERIKK